MFGLLKKTAEVKGRIGLAFGRDHIALAMVSRTGDRPILERCELLPLVPGSDPDATAAAVRAANLPRMPISVVLNAEDYQLALVEAPDVPPAELRAAMRWRLKEAIDIPVEDAVIDVFEVPPQSRGTQGRMMYAVAARRAAIARYGAALASLPSFDVVDVPELCLRNLAAVLPAAARGVALLHLGETTATMILVQGRTFYFSRQMNLHSSAAGPVDGSHDTPSVLPDAAGIVLELQRSLDYYERHFDQAPVTRIAIVPAGPSTDDLAAKLSRETGFEVEALDLNAALQCASTVAAATQANALLAVGAAMRDARRTL